MAHDPDTASPGEDALLFHGLIEADGRSYSNWGLHRTTTPAVYAEPISTTDVQALVRDSARFPTPVHPAWQHYSREYNELAIHRLGGRASPIQTQWLKAGDVTIPRKLARPRFTTPYYARFLE